MADQKNSSNRRHQEMAAEWLAREDRGLTGSEQDEFVEWMADDVENARAIHELRKVWRLCDRLEEWRPSHSGQPNPDLLAPKSPPSRFKHLAIGAMALAAVLPMALLLPLRLSPPETTGPDRTFTAAARYDNKQVITGINGLHHLEDGSLVEMSRNTILEIHFCESRRLVYLVRGEADFTVAHDASRPFIVEVAGVTVQALGTIFRVGLKQFDVSVEVTEGSVEVREASQQGKSSDPPGIVLAAGEKAVLRYARLIPFETPPSPLDQTPSDQKR